LEPKNRAAWTLLSVKKFLEFRSKLFQPTRTDVTLERRYFLTFFGLQSRFFFAATAPHSLQRKSPGFAGRIGLPFKQPIANSLDAASTEFT
jgi:hypothetical protein